MSEENKSFTVISAIDGSEVALKAVNYVINIIGKENRNQKIKLIGLTVIDLTKLNNSFIESAAGYVDPKKFDVKKKETDLWLNQVKEVIKRADINNIIQYETEVLEDALSKPSSVIIDYAERKNADLIVVGTRGRTGFKKMLLGSVASEIVTYAHCPVLVVR